MLLEREREEKAEFLLGVALTWDPHFKGVEDKYME